MSNPYNSTHGTWSEGRFRFRYHEPPSNPAHLVNTRHRDTDTTSAPGSGGSSTNDSFPILVTTVRSARHELLFVSPHWPFARLGTKICDVLVRSPNCSSHTPAGAELTHLSEGPVVPPGKIRALRVRWARDGARDAPGWPELTVVTEENHAAVLSLVWQRVNAGRADVLEAELSSWGGEEGFASGGERLPSYGEVDRGLA